ncbi:MAG: zinc ribbon domain-containing protein [Chloroflexi bacterium]|nr:zinc ribbon domain-containing protein [Chloroflexota bacterium]
MPIYEYRCQACRRKVSILVRSFSAPVSPACERCGSHDLVRLVSSFAVVRSDRGSGDDSSLDDALGDVDERDPRSMARAMRRIGEESGEDLGPEFDEAVSRMEAGEGPEEAMEGLEPEGDAGDSAIEGSAGGL